MTGINENQNEHAGRNNGKSVGRPAGVYGVEKIQPQSQPQHETQPQQKQQSQSAEKRGRGRPRKSESEKASSKASSKVKYKNKSKKKKPEPDKQPVPDISDFKVPADFRSMEDPRITEQLERIAESLIRTNDEFIPFADEASRGNPDSLSTSPIASWYSGAARYLPLKLSYLAACANLGWIRSQQAKVECTYDASGRLKSRKITQSTGNPAYLALAQSLLDAEMKWAEKMKPAQNSRIVLEVPAGGDVRKHKILDLIRKKLELQKEQEGSQPDSDQQ